MGNGNFRPHRIDTPQPITKKFVTGDYVGDQIRCISVHGGLLGTWVKYNQNYFYLCPLFGNAPTGQTPRRIFTHDGSNDADSRRDVPFLGIFHIVPHLGVNNPQFWSVNRRFQAKLAKSKSACYQNYCIDSNHILHNDKDHQMPFVGGPHTRITNPRWRTAAIVEKSKNRHISVAV